MVAMSLQSATKAIEDHGPALSERITIAIRREEAERGVPQCDDRAAAVCFLEAVLHIRYATAKDIIYGPVISRSVGRLIACT